VTGVSLVLLATLLDDELQKHIADPSPVRDASETDVVDMNFRVDPDFAAAYVRTRMLYAFDRLRASGSTGDAVNDALIVLGGFVHLQDLCNKQVAA
jgi:hypothetical protein